MKVCYDLHIHSALSPCADNDMTPVNIVAAASGAGIEMLAVSDHNSIKNVPATMEIGEALGITVVPAMELQTAEDVHILCLFETYEGLQNFYSSILFTVRPNRPEILGEQLIFNSDDEVIGHEESMLSAGAGISEADVAELAATCGGVAVPAHIDRDTNGIISVLGDVPPSYNAVELSANCAPSVAEKYAQRFRVIYNSDSHYLMGIGEHKHLIDIEDNSAKALLSYLRGE